MEKSEIIKSLITVSAPLISSITDSFLKPKIKELSDIFSIKTKNFEHLIENKFNKYLINSYEKYSIINTIVFHNQQKLLKELYIPLTVVNSDKQSFVIDNYNEKLLSNFQRVLITDTAGMGKSTIMKRIFLSIIDENKGIPILIELRRLSKSKDIIDEIIEQLSTINEVVDKSFVLHLIQKGDFIFLLDGFDEIPLDSRKTVTKQIQTFINKAGNNFFILTSRPETALSSFGDFKEFKINSLTKLQAFELLTKYDHNGTLSKQLIKKLKEHQYENIEEFLHNPLLVSLLFAAYEHKQTIPLKKHIFYRQVYDALFESHDLTKGDSFIRGKFSLLDIDEFHRVLRHIGYNCIIKGKIEFTKDEILNLITEAKGFTSGLIFKESDFLKDLINTVPLFTIDGIYYRWSHKSLQEYFAAQFIFLDSKEAQKDILIKIYKHSDSDRFLNLLDLYYSIDYKSFSEVIIYNLLNDFFVYLQESYKYINSEHKKERQLITFAYDYVFIKFSLDKHKDLKNLWANASDGISNKDWELLINPVSNEEKINFIKVPVSKKFTAKILGFLLMKKEKFVKVYKVVNERNIIIDIEDSIPYFLTDNKKLILNSTDIFKKTNSLIIIFNHQGILTIDEEQGQKALKKIRESMTKNTKDRLLNF
ncbi:NACHT domain-containing protein [Cytophaga hutchinsonii]|uniref:Uncharacterized protein n=1 Tax=Cytophaga hutchinsonii (strain ATCC 33406 / DSM 1761 / CIP 103989 / NBRC 15051 / NCIMB 9469 / D465) TaxID=269798 RepID=A0A6N4SQ31_CYTH3|nr:NACHT domain-containing protein [Cytophaga hutchinsonii]ABG58460.1 conserved hypothetical protein [Cytophaga hutchinsonii ATCC 33406]SFX74916.1 NACHT domain-containing protein [Cytophaga hutchinsonii ATCC 33406]